MDHEQAEDLKERGNQKLGAKQFDDAIDLYTQAIRLNDQNAVYFNNRATAYLGAGLVKKALADCDQSLRIDPRYGRALFRRGCVYVSLGRFREAKADFQSFANCEPSNTQHQEKLQVIAKIEQHMHNAEEYCKRGDFEQASQFYNAALSLAPHANSIKIGLAKTLLGRKMYNEAAKQASSVLQNDPEDIDALLARAKAFYGLGEDWKTLGPYLRNILQLDPDNTEANQLRKKSQTIFNLKNQGNEKFSSLKQLRGESLPDEEKNALKAQYSQEAIQFYQEAMQIDPENPTANATLLFNIAVVKLELGKQLEALTELDKALALNPDYAKLYAIRANINTQLEKFQEAVRDYHEASTREPHNADLKAKLKEAQKKLKESEKKDYYKIMDLPRNCTEYDIKKKYKKLAMEYHPDRHATKTPEEQEVAALKFKDINEANSILSDPKKRQRFDSGADDMEGHGMGDFDMSDIFANMGRRGGGGGFGGGGASFNFGGGGGGNPFGGFGGSGGGGHSHYY